MSEPANGAKPAPAAWQPLTFGGVAAFAGAPLGRLLLVELAAALMAAAAVVWFAHRAYCPVILEAIQKMPESACVADGQLKGLPETLMAESRFLAIAVTPGPGGEIGQDADLQIQLRQTDFCAESAFWPDWGLEFRYGKGTAAGLGRSNLEPSWSAWQPVLLTGLGAAAAFVLLALWALLAALYMAPAKFISWFADRDLTWGGAWRLASAALLPGAVVMAAAIILYGLAAIDLVGLSFFFTVHLIIGWIYVAGGAIKLQRLFPANPNRNPFTA